MASPQPTLAYHVYGDDSLPAVMLLHGFMSCDGQWLLNHDALSEHHRLVSVELWGHGDSPAPSDVNLYSVDAYIAQFEQIRKKLGINTWSLIGQSYGAGLVLNYAQSRPQVCEKVVVTNSRSAFGSLSASSGTESTRKNSLNEADFDVRKLPYHPIHARRFPDDVKAHLVSRADAIDVSAIRDGGRLGNTLHSFDRLEQIPHPVLLANGKHEKAFQDDAQRLRAHYPDLLVADLDAGHSVNIEAASGFNKVVLAFLDDPS